MTGRLTDLRDQLEGTSTPPSPTGSPATAALSDGASTPAPTEAPPPSKFTVLLDPHAAVDFDQLALDIRRLLGRRVSKGDLVRTLLALAAADPRLRDQLLDELRAHPTA
ncbi:MAG: hypothetical protein ABR608_13485 [Pseudonocardiaceae bacterium]